MNYPFSVSSYYLGITDPFETVSVFASQGIFNTELSFEHCETLAGLGNDTAKAGRAFRSHIDSLGFTVPQAHLDFIHNPLIQQKVIDKHKSWIDMYLEIGIKAAVIHASGVMDRENKIYEPDNEEYYEKNLAALRELTDYVKGTDLVLCLENLGTWPLCTNITKLMRFVNDLDTPNIGICLDTGHLNRERRSGFATETPSEFIRTAGSKLRALHINDNAGTDDLHVMPYSMKKVLGLDWDDFLRGMASADYKGLFNYEVPAEGKGPLELRLKKLEYLRYLDGYLQSLY